MSTLQQIEASIQSLPRREFYELSEWMTNRHLTVLAGNEFEAPELEAALLPSLDSPRHEVSEALFDDIRRLSGKAVF